MNNKIAELSKHAVLAVFLGAMTFAVAGCDDGPMEDAGERLDDAGDEIGHEVDELEDDVENQLD